MTSLLFLLLSLSTAMPIVTADASGGSSVDAPPAVAAPAASPAGTQWAQATIEQRIIIRVPMRRLRAPPPPDDVWEEHKGPKCISLGRVRAAAVTSSRGVDLMLAGRERMRALLGRECGAADLYSGLYIQPNEDGQLCAGRDRVLARSGADCPIKKLVRLVPEDD